MSERIFRLKTALCPVFRITRNVLKDRKIRKCAETVKREKGYQKHERQQQSGIPH